MTKGIDLDRHFSITSSNQVSSIAAPLTKNYDIKYFRYLKLYPDKSRVLLSTLPDCVRFSYEDDTYQKMWFDGEYPECLSPGFHFWDAHRGQETTAFEQEINHNLGLYHGMTFVSPVVDSYWELFTFDSEDQSLYQIDKQVFTHFMLYFKEQALKLIKQGESEKIIIPNSQKLEVYQHPNKDKLLDFINKTRVKRYYLGGAYRDVYLTSKEAQCIYWLIKGKSAEEIALLEGNTIKTIQRHLENVRSKLNCYKQTQLVKIILDSGIYEAMNLYNI